MFQVAIWSTNEISNSVKIILERPYNVMLRTKLNETIAIPFLISNTASDKIIHNAVVIDLNQAVQLYKNQIIHAIVIPREHILGHNNIIHTFIHLGVDVQDIYITQRINLNMEYTPENVSDFIQQYAMTPFLSYLEYHIADHCNLNCVACEHYSGLVDKPVFPNLEKWKKDIAMLKKYIDDIGTIRILGGEPLLNKEIEEYMKITRAYYPHSYIFIVTNALLLTSMPESFFNTMREHNIYLYISYYLPLKDKMSKILSFLRTKNVQYHLSELNEHFTIKQTLHPNNNPQQQFFNCFQSRCNNLYDGYMGACFLPFTTKYFNKHFNLSLPEDGKINLYDDNLTTETLKLLLLSAFERCRYCEAPKSIKWRQMSKPSTLEDWVNI